jgi:hypothetical protein
MSINATALYPWLQTPTVEKFPPENKILASVYTAHTLTSSVLLTVFDSTSIGGFTNGGILMGVDLYRNSSGGAGVESALQFGGYDVNLNAGGPITYYNPGMRPAVIPDSTVAGQFGQKDQTMLRLDLGIRFTSSLVLQLSLDRSGSNFGIIAMARYYKL